MPMGPPRCSRGITVALTALLVLAPAAALAERAAAPDGAASPAAGAPPEATAAAPPAAAPPLLPDPAAGATTATVCGGCHGPDGNAPNPIWPKLAGQRAAYVGKQLRDFQAGRRVDPVMSAMAAPLSEQDIADVAIHFEGLSIRAGAADPAQAARGEELYRHGRPEDRVLACVACHGVRGEGFSAGVDGGFPAVGGQNAAYLTKQLQSFRAGARANDWQGVMRLVAANLSDEDIAALVAYMSSLPREEPEKQLATGG